MKRTSPPDRTAAARPRSETFELGSDRDNAEVLEQAEKAAVAAAQAGGLDDDDAHFLGVAVREAAMNGLVHGCGPAGPSTTVRVTTSDRGVLVATVTDKGPGFDPGAVPDPRADENMARGSGRGLFFMRCFADRVRFSFPRRGGAVVRLEKDLRRA
jgi:serine/threonine-protein kinase RsbW